MNAMLAEALCLLCLQPVSEHRGPQQRCSYSPAIGAANLEYTPLAAEPVIGVLLYWCGGCRKWFRLSISPARVHLATRWPCKLCDSSMTVRQVEIPHAQQVRGKIRPA